MDTETSSFNGKFSFKELPDGSLDKTQVICIYRDVKWVITRIHQVPLCEITALSVKDSENDLCVMEKNDLLHNVSILMMHEVHHFVSSCLKWRRMFA